MRKTEKISKYFKKSFTTQRHFKNSNKLQKIENSKSKQYREVSSPLFELRFAWFSKLLMFCLHSVQYFNNVIF